MLTINRKVAGEPVNPDAHVKPALASKGLAVLDTVDPDEPVLDRIDLSTSSDHLLTADAKRDYFLVSGDLAGCEIYRPGGYLRKDSKLYELTGGVGRSQYFERDELEAKAIAKHGVEGWEKKKQSRLARANKKRKFDPEDTAKLAIGDLTGDVAAASPKKPRTDSKVLALRKAVIAELTPMLTWEYLQKNKTPNGTLVSVRVGKVDQPMFARMLERETDPELAGLSKKGVWFSESVKAAVFFGKRVDIRGKMNGNADLGLDTTVPLTVKYLPAAKLLSVQGYISPVDTHQDLCPYAQLAALRQQFRGHRWHKIQKAKGLPAPAPAPESNGSASDITTPALAV